jgi:hypothetical protein
MSTRSDPVLPGAWVGAVFQGYCDGYFGRDAYGEKRVEAVGFDWCVARMANSYRPCLVFAESYGESIEPLLRKWLEEQPPGDSGPE